MHTLQELHETEQKTIAKANHIHHLIMEYNLLDTYNRLEYPWLRNQKGIGATFDKDVFYRAESAFITALKDEYKKEISTCVNEFNNLYPKYVDMFKQHNLSTVTIDINFFLDNKEDVNKAKNCTH